MDFYYLDLGKVYCGFYVKSLVFFLRILLLRHNYGAAYAVIDPVLFDPETFRKQD